MKINPGISRKYVLFTAVIFSLLIIIISVSFHLILRANTGFIRDTLMRDNELLLSGKARLAVERLKGDAIKRPRELAAEIRERCAGDEGFLHAIIFKKTEDENYFEVLEHVAFDERIKVALNKKDIVKEDKEVNYLKKAVFALTVDPQIRISGGVPVVSVYAPLKSGNRTAVIQFIMSSERTHAALREYADKTDRTKKYLIALAAGLIAAVAAASLLFVQNFALFVRRLSSSMERAAGGELSVSMNPAIDEDLSELALSFNSLIGELKAKEKSIQELENKDALDDLFKYGVSLLKENRYADAIAVFTTLVLMRPGSFGGHFNLGVAYAKTGDHERSLAMFEKALEADPGHERTLQYIEKVKSLKARHESVDAGTER